MFPAWLRRLVFGTDVDCGLQLRFRVDMRFVGSWIVSDLQLKMSNMCILGAFVYVFGPNTLVSDLGALVG